MSVMGIGIDAVDIARFKTAVERHGKLFLEKIFTDKEMDHAGTKKAYFMHMAGKFAAKEAVKKALPNGAEIGFNWRDIEILNDKDGKPYVCLHGSAKRLVKQFKLGEVFVSISHTDEIAAANALAEKKCRMNSSKK